MMVLILFQPFDEEKNIIKYFQIEIETAIFTANLPSQFIYFNL
jgi:hypothetical protein